MQFIMIDGIGSVPVECSFEGFTTTAVVTATSHLTPDCPAGADYAGRYVFAWVYWVSALTETLVSATIAGVDAEIYPQTSFSSGGFTRPERGFVLISAEVPAGAAVDIATTFSGDVDRPDIFTYRVINLVSDAVIDSQINGGTASDISLDADCDVVAGGVVFFALCAGWNPETCDLTGTSQDFEQAVRGIDNFASGGFYLPLADETPRAFNSTLTNGGGGGNPNHANIVASFR
ncbi:MAG: hypothetical protein E5X35_11450 [Mesorhizobium sp.]|nr:hypothetical protein EOA85_00290 [Mesorhizobium sp. M5C.F.Ca.IN.020.29.1.1]TIR33274.1 MAG: hypothetical protein E5X35_11450 [Mesorhizobium sp.]